MLLIILGIIPAVLVRWVILRKPLPAYIAFGVGALVWILGFIFMTAMGAEFSAIGYIVTPMAIISAFIVNSEDSKEPRKPRREKKRKRNESPDDVGNEPEVCLRVTSNCKESGHLTRNQNEGSEALSFDSPHRPKRTKFWIAISVAFIAFAIISISYFANRNAVNKELSPLILATELNPDDPYAWTSLAAKAYGLKRYSMAEDAAKKAIASGVRGKSGGYLWLGRVYREQGKNKESIYCFQRSSSFHARIDLGDLYLEVGEFEQSTKQYLKAIELLEEEVKKDDVGWWDWNNLGDAYLKLGMKNKAHDAFATALTLGDNLNWIEEKLTITEH